MKIANRHANDSRIVNLDFLRGVVIILAIQQHLIYYLNVWFISYFKDFSALSSTYESLLPLMNKNLPMDIYNHFMAVAFTPWVSQIYLSLAAFNLAKRSQKEFKPEYFKKIKVYFLIFLTFLFENFLVAPNTGEAISFYPIMLWMVVLGILATLYNFSGIKGVITLGLVSLLRFILPIEESSNFLQELVRIFIHPNFEYDARLEYFILSGVIGFVLGYLYYHSKRKMFLKLTKVAMLLSVVYAIVFFFLGPSFEVSYDDILMTEHLFAQSFLGTFYISSLIVVVIGAALLLEENNVKISIGLINWVGENSILVFFSHRILITKVLIPLYLLFGCMLGFLPQNNIVVAYSAVMIVVSFCYLLKKSNIAELIIKNK